MGYPYCMDKPLEDMPEDPDDIDESLLHDLAADEVAKLTSSIMSGQSWREHMGPVSAAYELSRDDESDTDDALREEMRQAEAEKSQTLPSAGNQQDEEEDSPGRSVLRQQARDADELLRAAQRLAGKDAPDEAGSRGISARVLEFAVAAGGVLAGVAIYVVLDMFGM